MSTTNVSYLDYNGLSLVANKVRERLQKVSSMPTSPSTGDVVLYIGTTSSSYTKGHIYQYNNNTWTDISPAGGSGSGDMLESDYDPDGNVKTAGGIEDYTSQTSLSRLENAVLGARNLLEIDRTTQTINGVNFKISSSGTITANGTATNDIYFILVDDLSLPITNLIVSKGYNSDISHNCKLIIDAYTINDVYVKTLANSYLTDEQNFLPDYEDYEIIKAALVISQNDTVSNLMIKPMIRFAIDPNNLFSAYCKTNKQLTNITKNLTTTVNNLTTTMLNKADKVSNATSGNFAGLDSNGNLTDSGSKASDFLTSHQDISGKADKVTGATNGNFAGLDANGNLTDSGSKASDFLTSHQDISGKMNTDGSNAASGVTFSGAFTVGSRVSGSTVGTNSFAQGANTEASQPYTHAEGNYTKASQYGAHAEGYGTLNYKITASGNGAHAEGYAANGAITASGSGAHAEGNGTTASGSYSHAGGLKTTAGYSAQTVVGKYNDNKSTTLFEVGNGSSSTSSNAFEVYSNGNINFTGNIQQNGTTKYFDSWLATTATVSNGSFTFSGINDTSNYGYKPYFNITDSSTNKNPYAEIDTLSGAGTSSMSITYLTDADNGTVVKLRIIK